MPIAQDTKSGNGRLTKDKTTPTLMWCGFKTLKDHNHKDCNDTFTIDPLQLYRSKKNVYSYPVILPFTLWPLFYKFPPQPRQTALSKLLSRKKTNVVTIWPFLHWPGLMVLESLHHGSLKLCSDRVAVRPLERLPVYGGRGEWHLWKGDLSFNQFYLVCRWRAFLTPAKAIKKSRQKRRCTVT